MEEQDRAEVIGAVVKGELSTSAAAERLQITVRQVHRLRIRFAEHGMSGMISRQRGKPSNHQLKPKRAQEALELVRAHYADFGPTLACEHLQIRHEVSISKETLRRLMIEAGLWIPRAAQPPRLHQPRERRACFGELVQIDGSRHHWFEKRREACTLLVYIDDATSQILTLHFAETESTNSYFAATRQYIERYGKPHAFYADRAATFRSPSATGNTQTQFQRALDELGIDLICANSPQAKGRVERANRTLQDRLVKDLRLEGIDTIDAANAWCSKFVERFNKRFCYEPRSTLDAHESLRPEDNLERILALCETRKLTKNLTLQYKNILYILNDKPGVRALISHDISIHTYADGRVELRANEQDLTYKTLQVAPRAKLIEVDSKAVHSTVDKTTRNYNYRADLPSNLITQRTAEAKKIARQKQV